MELSEARFTRRAWMAAAGAAVAAKGARIEGSVLVHEHVLVDFGGAKVDSRSRYELDEAFKAALPKVEELKPLGCVRFQECTPNFLGRDGRLLKRLEDATGIEMWTNTGIYGAANRSGVPAFAYQETAEQLAKRWIVEREKGVDGLKPRFIKTAVNGFPLEEIDVKLVTAAAMVARETGMALCSHTGGGGRAAMAQLEILDKQKCPARRFVWVHAQSEKDHEFHERAARAGAWVEFDGINEKSEAWHLECVRHMSAQKLLGRTLISQDSGWYRVGEPGGGRYNGYTFIYTSFLPKLAQEDARRLMVDNPREAFA